MKCVSCTGSHKYEARFDEVPTTFNITRIRAESTEEGRKLLYRRVYVRDVCVKCGHAIERTQNGSTRAPT